VKDRREFLRLAAFSAAAASFPLAATAAPIDGPGGGPWWLFAPARPGQEIGLGWALARVFPAQDGAITVNLLHVDGRTARVDLSLRDGPARGPAYTDLVDFIVMDGGDGRAPMVEDLGRAVRRLAALVADNEGQALDVLARMDPHAERVQAFPDAMALASRRLAPGAA